MNKDEVTILARNGEWHILTSEAELRAARPPIPPRLDFWPEGLAEVREVPTHVPVADLLGNHDNIKD